MYWHQVPSNNKWVLIDSPFIACRGIVHVVDEDTPAPRSNPPAPIGEKVILIVNKSGVPTGEYERFMTFPIEEGEPQRWYALDTSPND